MMRMSDARNLVITAFVWMLASQGLPLLAGENDLPDTQVQIQRVALFKNGLAFVSSGAILPANARTVRLGQLPVPSYGTFWVDYPPAVRLRTLIASMEEVTERAPALSLGQLLLANAGRRVKIRTGPGEADVLEGTVLASDETAPPRPPSPYFMDTRRGEDTYARYGSGNSQAGVLTIQTDAGIVALNPGSVIRADFDDGEILQAMTLKQRRPMLRMELDTPAGGQPIAVSCLARGVTWAPGYLIDLSDSKTARFSAHALVVNELVDLHGVQLELVTGFPNILFGDVLNPIAMSQNLEGFLNALASGRSESARGDRRMMSQQAGRMSNIARYEEAGAGAIPGYSTAMGGQTSEDLFLYPVKDFSLGKNETAWIPLFTAEMPYRHIYTWKIDDTLDKEDRQQSGSDPDNERKGEEVWHSCRLRNTLRMPLTTASVEFVKNGQFTGQDICYYTSPGAETTIRINRAMNILADQAEVETERSRNITVFQGYQYDLVKVKGELCIQSRLDQPVTVEISKELSGEVLQSTPTAKDVMTIKGLKQVNQQHVLTWEIELQPGTEQKLLYAYQVYIRN